MIRDRILAAAFIGLSLAPLADPSGAEAQNKAAVTVVANIGGLDDVGRAVFSRDGAIVATLDGYQSHNVRLWDVASRRPLRTLDDDVYFDAVAFSPDTRWIASGHKDGKLKLWDVATGAVMAMLANGGHDDEAAVTSLWVDPKGELLVVGTAQGLVTVWDIAQRKPLHVVKFGSIPDKDRLPRILDARLTADAGRMIALTEESLRVFDVRSGKPTMSYDLPNTGPAIPGRQRLAFFAGSIVADDALIVRQSSECKADGLMFMRLTDPKSFIDIDKPARCGQTGDDPDAAFPYGEPLVVASADRPEIFVARFGLPEIEQWDAQARKVVRTITWPDAASARLIGVAPDLKLAASRDGNKIAIRQLESGAPAGELTSFLYPADNVVAAKDVLLISHDRPRSEPAQKDVQLWRIDALTPKAARLAAGSETSVHDFAPGPMLALAANEKGEAILFSLATGAEQRRFTVPGVKDISRLRLSPDGKMIALVGTDADDKSVALLLAAADGAVKIRFQGRDERNGMLASSGSDDENDLVTTVAFSPDSQKVAIGRWNGAAEVWSIDKARRILQLPADRKGGDQTWSLGFSDDGRLLVGGSRDAGVFLWDLTSGRLVRTFERDTLAGHVHFASVAVSHDHKVVVGGNAMHAVSSGDTGIEHGINVWNAATGKLLFTLRGHEGGIGALAFSSDDRMIISASFDGTIRYWDRATGKWLATFAAAPDGRWVVITDSGLFAGSLGSADFIDLVRGLQSRPGAQFHDGLFQPDLVEQLLKGDREGRYRAAAQKLDLDKVWAAHPAP